MIIILAEWERRDLFFSPFVISDQRTNFHFGYCCSDHYVNELYIIRFGFFYQTTEIERISLFFGLWNPFSFQFVFHFNCAWKIQIQNERLTNNNCASDRLITFSFHIKYRPLVPASKSSQDIIFDVIYHHRLNRVVHLFDRYS